ncbi:MAG: phosphopantetheine-binding protein [Actinomycetota bacterium]
MVAMQRHAVLGLMNDILRRAGKAPVDDEGASLRELGFRSLDFSELALRVEDEVGHELNFDAPELRAITTVGDVLDFFAAAEPAPGGAPA